jgi:hypothetical protein
LTPDEDLTEEEIEELIIGAISPQQMMKLGMVKPEDTNKAEKNFDSTEKMVTKDKFLKVLASDTNENKIKIPRKLKKFEK